MNMADEPAYPNGLNYLYYYYYFLGGGGLHPRECKYIIYFVMLVVYDSVIFVCNHEVYLSGIIVSAFSIARSLQSARFQ